MLKWRNSKDFLMPRKTIWLGAIKNSGIFDVPIQLSRLRIHSIILKLISYLKIKSEEQHFHQHLPFIHSEKASNTKNLPNSCWHTIKSSHKVTKNLLRIIIWISKLLDFTCLTLKFHNCHYTTQYVSVHLCQSVHCYRF